MSGERDLDLPPPPRTDWWHQFDELLSLHLPDLTGKTVLDVGARDGYFSFAAERFGASRVLSVEPDAWRRPGGKARFEYMRRTLASRVEDLELDVLDISPEEIGRFDVVLFVGALPYMTHPLLALERLASVTQELLVVETLVDLNFGRLPAVAFRPSATPVGEAGEWAPNRAAVSEMLRSVGFQRVVSYPVKRLSAARMIGLPARVRLATDRVSSAPWRSRRRLMTGLARSALMHSHVVAHGWREQEPSSKRALRDACGPRPRRGGASRTRQDVRVVAPISVLRTAS
jgi:tRNA (mo5U34)-methyltransferase